MMSLPPPRHRVAGVEREIEQRGCELVRVDGRRASLVLEHRFDLDLLAERRAQQFCGVDDQRVDVGLARLQRLLAGKGQQMLGQLGAARGGLIDHPGDGGKLRLVGDRLGEDFDGAGDHGQDVVEVVGDAAGELADRLHLLGMADAVFGGDLVGEVADEAVEDDAVAALQLGDGEFDLELLAVAAQRLDLEPAAEDPAFAGEQEVLEARAMRVAIAERER